MPYPLPLTRTEAYLAYKAGVIQQSDLKPSLAIPRNGIDAWLAYWTGLAENYPKKPTVNLFDKNEITVGVRVSTSNGGTYSQAGYAVSSFIPISPLTTYALVCGTAAGGSFFSWYDSSKHYISGSGWQNKRTWKSPANARYIKFDFKVSEKDIVQFEKAPLSPYSPYTAEPLILQEEEAYIAYLCGVVSEYPEKCLRRVGAYLRYLISARWGRPDRPLNREELYLSLIKTQFIPSGDPSSDIVIDGTAKAPFVDVKMYGDTFQQTYTGKNLIDMPIVSGSINGVTWVVNSDGSITLNGTATAHVSIRANGVSIPAVAGETYTLSATGLQNIFNFGYKNSVSGANVLVVTNDAPVITVQVTAEMLASANRLDMFIVSGSSFNNQRVTLQLEKGSTASSYEPFVGGQPSPSPDYPQQIQTVTGEQTVEIVGKNLFDISKADMMVARLNSSGGITLDVTNRLCTRGYIGVKPSTTYTFNALPETSGKTLQAYIVGYSESGSGTAIGNYPTNAWYSFPITFTTGSNCRFIRISYRYSDDSTMATTSATNQQLELGSTASAYTPYSSTDYPISLGSIELCKLGTYQDYIWKDGDDWKEHKAVAKHALMPNEGWLIPNPASYPNLFQTNAISDLNKLSDEYTAASTSPQAYCEALVYLPGSGDVRTTQGFSLYHTIEGGVAYNIARINLTGFTTTTQLNNWLRTCNASFWYGVKEPTDTTITDQTLIAQLEALVSGGAENGTTYIKVKATDPNLPGLLYVEAPKYD